jgi:xanthine dehydrogenase small subunit
VTRDHLLFYLNGERLLVRGEAVFLTLSEYLRDELRLVGTKVVCAEGDCGACSVLVGRPAADRLEYLPIDACITFLHQLDASHVVTVEGLARDGQLHPVQQAMVDGYGSQCGFCTPGIVMALAGHFEARAEACRHAADPSAPPTDARLALTGNLCRCTGYWQILESAAALDGAAVPRLAEHYPEAAMLAELRAAERDAVRIAAPPRQVLVAADLDAACRFRAEHPDCGVVAGATDVAVRRNKGAAEPESVLALGRRIPGFADAAIEGDVLRAGAGATWARLLDLVAERLPDLAQMLERFGAPQIRNAATLGGNLANASPIADSLPFLYVAGAVLELRGPADSRRVPIESFYRGYKQLDLRPGELIAAVDIPLPGRGDELRLYKMSRRRALDIASFTAAVLVRRAGAAGGVGVGVSAAADAGRAAPGQHSDPDTIASARLAYGGVGPTVLRLPRAEAFLAGRPFTLETFRRAGEIAATETTPWTDVRGSDGYRRRLAENALVKFFHDVANPDAAVCEPLPLDRATFGRTAPQSGRPARACRR